MKNYGAYIETSFGTNKSSRVICSTYLIDPKGVISYHWPEVIPKGHAKRTLNKLEEIIKKKLN